MVVCLIRELQKFSSLSRPGKAHWRILIDMVQEGTISKYGVCTGRFYTSKIMYRWNVCYTTISYLKCWGVNKKVYATFTDLEKACDTVDRSMQRDVLDEYSATKYIPEVVRWIYENLRVSVRAIGLEFHRKWQGCVRSSFLEKYEFVWT